MTTQEGGYLAHLFALDAHTGCHRVPISSPGSSDFSFLLTHILKGTSEWFKYLASCHP